MRYLYTGVFLLLGPAIAIGGIILHIYSLIEMGISVWTWVAIGLGIFFLSVIGILIKWDQEHHRRQAQSSNAASEAPSGPPSSTEQILAPQDACYTYDDTPGRGYPHKLWIVLSNESGREIIVRPARWEVHIGDIDATPSPEQQPWTPEIAGGWQRNRWGQQTVGPLHLAQGRAGKIWVGLLGSLDDLAVCRTRVFG
jgi:hypothetical protein